MNFLFLTWNLEIIIEHTKIMLWEVNERIQMEPVGWYIACSKCSIKVYFYHDDDCFLFVYIGLCGKQKGNAIQAKVSRRTFCAKVSCVY
jgi:hypothetical protein